MHRHILVYTYHVHVDLPDRTRNRCRNDISRCRSHIVRYHHHRRVSKQSPIQTYRRSTFRQIQGVVYVLLTSALTGTPSPADLHRQTCTKFAADQDVDILDWKCITGLTLFESKLCFQGPPSHGISSLSCSYLRSLSASGRGKSRHNPHSSPISLFSCRYKRLDYETQARVNARTETAPVL